MLISWAAAASLHLWGARSQPGPVSAGLTRRPDRQQGSVDFCDQIDYPVLNATGGRPYAYYVHGNNDTTGAAQGD
jgi:hypothetical protein